VLLEAIERACQVFLHLREEKKKGTKKDEKQMKKEEEKR